MSQIEKAFTQQIKLSKAEMNIQVEGTYFIEIHAGNDIYTNKMFYKK